MSPCSLALVENFIHILFQIFYVPVKKYKVMGLMEAIWMIPTTLV